MHLSSVLIDNKGFEHSLDLAGASATLSVTTNGNYLLRFSEAGSSLALTLERDQIDALAAICAAPLDHPSASPADPPPNQPNPGWTGTAQVGQSRHADVAARNFSGNAD